MAEGWILTLTCADRVGIVAGIAGVLARHDGFILDSQQYADLETGRFFMRVVFASGGTRFPDSAEDLAAAIEPTARDLGLDWSVSRLGERTRVVVAVSRGSHCLHDLLHRQQSGTLAAEIVAIVSNHDHLRSVAEWHGIAYHHLPIGPDGHVTQEEAIEAVMADAHAPWLVLARYMQVLSPGFAERLTGRCINIHHSFLPGFKGSRPYHRAHARGVKLIGATAHFVTSDLDEGPIIEQAVERVDHRDSVDDLIRLGRDIEAQVLARAVQAVGERRLFMNGNRTVVFR